MELIIKAFAAKLEKGETKKDADRRRLLNAIAGYVDDLDAPACEMHQQYEALNFAFAGYCAAGTFRRAFQEKLPVDAHVAALAGSSLRRLELSLEGISPIGDHELVLLARAFPETLEHLDLDLFGCEHIKG